MGSNYDYALRGVEDQSHKDGIMKLIYEIEQLWTDVRVARLNNKEAFDKLDDDKKIKMFINDNNKYLYEKHPLVIKYMILLNMFHTKALSKYLYKVRNIKLNKQKSHNNQAIIRDKWFETQADYIKYLYSILYPKYSSADLKKIWESTYLTIKKEFNLLEEEHKRATKKIELKEQQHKLKKINSIADVISQPEIKISKRQSDYLRYILQQANYNKYYKAVLKQLTTVVVPIKAKLSGNGTHLGLEEQFETEKVNKYYKEKLNLT